MKKKLPELVKRVRSIKIPKPDYKNNKIISYSQYSRYNTCEYKWYLQYVKKLSTFTDNIHTIFGTAIHETIQSYVTVIYNSSGVEADKMDLETMFVDTIIQLYKEKKEKADTHFTTPEELNEFIEDGIEILNNVKKNRNTLFKKRNYYLLGIELPILQLIDGDYDKVQFYGLVDIALYDAKFDRVKIIDIKTSTRGWSKYKKKDKVATDQLLLYKKFISQQYMIDESKIDIEYVIVKRKVPEDTEFPIKRIQTFKPSDGRNTLSRINRELNGFIQDNFDSNGNIIKNNFSKTPNISNCKFCDFNNTEHCIK